MYSSIRFAWAYKNLKFVSYSITKYIKFQSINNQTIDTFDQYQRKLDLIEIVSKIVLYIVQEFGKF